MRRIFKTSFSLSPYNFLKCQYYKPKPDILGQNGLQRHSLFSQKSFREIISILKNPDNPYPKNAAYYNAILEYILDESNNNSKVMIEYGEIIHVFLQDIMERIKNMNSKELSDVLSLLRFRPKALRFQKQLLITMHVRFQNRIKQLIQLNQSKVPSNPEQILTIQDVRCQLEGLFYLKKNTTVLNEVLNYAYQIICIKQRNTDHNDKQASKRLKQEEAVFYSLIQIINENIDDTIDPVRESIAEFIQENYHKNHLPYNKQIIRMIVKCKFYKNYPIVRNQDWLHSYVYRYLQNLIRDERTTDIEQMVSVLKSVINYALHIDPWSRQGFFDLIDKGYHIAKRNLLAISYLNDKQQLSRQVNTISLQIKLIPSYLYIKNYYKINTVQFEEGNKVDSTYIKTVIEQIKPLIKKFILCYFDKEQVRIQGVSNSRLTKSIQENIDVLSNIVKIQDDPEKILLKSVQNLLNIVTVFKDYNIIEVDTQFSLLLIQTEVIYCILCRYWISDQVRYLRLLEHSIFVLSELQKHLEQQNPKFLKHSQRINLIRAKMQEELAIYDNVEKSYKQFTVLRLVAILKCINMTPKYLGDFYKNIKLKKPNIYVQTLSRTMLKVYNYNQVIDAFQLMFQGKIPVKQIELGRIVFLSSKQPQLLKYWMHHNRKHFVDKICFCRRIINNIVSIIRMDNLQINRNSIQILSQIVIQNKLFQIQNNSISNHQEGNTLKKILCNNFSILFRYSKMDAMVDDIFIVHKNIPTIFRNKFSHIEAIKILTFSAYLAEQQSIFYVNRENKNALFKYVIMLMRKEPFCERSRKHFLLGGGYNEQAIIMLVVDKIIEQYWPDNKLMNKGMPFYAQFLNYYTQINQFPRLVQNQNTIFLIIKQILQDYRQIQNKSQLKFIISRLQNNYERLHFLSIFEHETNINDALQNVISSMNFVMDIKIFGDFVQHVQKQIRQEIQDHRRKSQQENTEKSLQLIQKPWKQKNAVNKYFVNVMLMENLASLDQFSDFQILSLMTVDVMSNGVRDQLNENMKLVTKRILKINPVSVRQTQSGEQKRKFPFEMFKMVLSNLNIYISNRQKRAQNGKELIAEDLNNDKLCEWTIKCLLTYCKEIQNNEQIEYVLRYFNNWSVDVLGLLNSKFFNLHGNLANLSQSYFNVQILSIFLSQNLIKYNVENSAPQSNGLSNQNILSYIKVINKQLQETHLMNNYGVYFQEQGQKVLNVIKSLLLMIMQHEKLNSKLYKDAYQQFKNVKELFEEFNKISNKSHKYNKLRSGSKYSYLYNEDQGQVVDMSESTPTKKRNPYSQETRESKSVSLKLFSKFSEILEIISLVRLSKWSAVNFNSTHQEQIKQISKEISKRQKSLLIHSELTYFTDSEVLIEQKVFEDFGLKLYVQKSGKEQKKLTVFYIVNEKESMLYDFAYKKRKRLSGQEQIIVDYIESLISVSKQMQSDKQGVIQVKILPNHLSKAELKKFLSGI